jgi:hypothetical protein
MVGWWLWCHDHTSNKFYPLIGFCLEGREVEGWSSILGEVAPPIGMSGGGVIYLCVSIENSFTAQSTDIRFSFQFSPAQPNRFEQLEVMLRLSNFRALCL